ncbi:hypothetical protein EXM89_07480 [Clostridium botulinum]|nr:hypothetical protein [Clostridium botulinum]NFB59844.1 hypothetical protein [Clostridium botulinum]
MERPILFNTEMVKAILEGKKTRTRRIIKKVSGFDFLGISSNDGSTFDHALFGKGSLDKILDAEIKESVKAPYLPGDILYVRETWAKVEDFKNYADVEFEDDLEFLYKCDDYGKEHTFIDVGVKRWHPSIHMPKAAARIFLKVVGVRVEKLQALDYEEAIREGIKAGYDGWTSVFKDLWDSTVNKKDIDMYGWNSNPWVWVIEFEKVRSNV